MIKKEGILPTRHKSNGYVEVLSAARKELHALANAPEEEKAAVAEHIKEIDDTYVQNLRNNKDPAVEAKSKRDLEVILEGIRMNKTEAAPPAAALDFAAKIKSLFPNSEVTEEVKNRVDAKEEELEEKVKTGMSLTAAAMEMQVFVDNLAAEVGQTAPIAQESAPQQELAEAPVTLPGQELAETEEEWTARTRKEAEAPKAGDAAPPEEQAWSDEVHISGTDNDKPYVGAASEVLPTTAPDGKVDPFYDPTLGESGERKEASGAKEDTREHWQEKLQSLIARVPENVGNAAGLVSEKFSRSYWDTRAKELDAKAEASGGEKIIRKMGEAYNKLNFRGKFGIGLVLAGSAVVTGGASIYLPYAFVGLIGVQRAFGAASLYISQEKALLDAKVTESKQFISAKERASFSAAMSGVLFGAAIGQGVEFAKEHDWVQNTREWLSRMMGHNTLPDAPRTPESTGSKINVPTSAHEAGTSATPVESPKAPETSPEAQKPSAATAPTAPIQAPERPTLAPATHEITGEQMVMGGPETPDIRPIPPEGIPLVQDISTEDWSGPPPGEVEAVDRQDVTPGASAEPEGSAPNTEPEQNSVYQDSTTGAMVANGETYAGRLADATEYLKAHHDARIWIEAEKPGDDGAHYMIEMKFKPGFLGGLLGGGEAVPVDNPIPLDTNIA